MTEGDHVLRCGAAAGEDDADLGVLAWKDAPRMLSEKTVPRQVPREAL